MKRSSNCFLTLVIMFGTYITSAQQLEGYLLDQAANQPIVFAHIAAKGKMLQTVSNDEGFFKLESEGVTNADTLLITHINYATISVPVQKFREQANSKIFLTEVTIELNELEIKATEDYQAFEDVVVQTQKSLHFPMTTSVYYRELVKENKSFNKFADGLLTVVYEKSNSENEIQFSVDQCRSVKLPKDEDDQFELVSPVKMELVLGYEFGNFLNRFRKENRENSFLCFTSIETE